MFCPEVSSVLLSDKFGNDMLCSILFTPWLSIYWRITSTGASPAVSRQKLWFQKASFLLFLKLDCQWLFFDISLPWSDDNTLDILNAHYDLFFPCTSVLFLTIYVFDWLYYTTDCIVEQVFFFQFISHLQRKENSCYIMLNALNSTSPLFSCRKNSHTPPHNQSTNDHHPKPHLFLHR